MAFLPAGFIDGARTPAEMLRRLAFAATAGDTGVVRAGDLRVTAAAVPAGMVYIQAGTGFAATRFADAYGSQSYIVANDAAYALTVPANTSGSAQTRYVIVRVTDPQYAGEPVPSNPLTDDYCVAELVSALPTTKPYLLLAKIELPASTGAVTQAMITDVREMVNPRRKRDLRAIALRAETGTNKLSATAGATWPPAGDFTVEVPAWATVMRFVASWAQILIPASTATVGKLALRVGAGRADQIDTDYTQLDTVSVGNAGRDTLSCAGEVAIPSTMRGASIQIQMRGTKTSGSSNVTVDASSAISLDMEFVEAPTQDVI